MRGVDLLNPLFPNYSPFFTPLFLFISTLQIYVNDSAIFYPVLALTSNVLSILCFSVIASIECYNTSLFIAASSDLLPIKKMQASFLLLFYAYFTQYSRILYVIGNLLQSCDIK